ncbi:flagellar type III secretion system pore protein FliP [Paracoccus ravus]|uniref:flagellar type III secretion system pore protein FliP n=1 Tax=Paracoccus ravus TaxID=2447760 RepID=UPI003144E0F8
MGQHAVSLFIFLTVISIAPGIAIMVTCFPFIVTVLSILRQSIGIQQAPPNMLIISLSAFLSWSIMSPVFNEAWEKAGAPLQTGTIDINQAFHLGITPFRRFMEGRVNPEVISEIVGVNETHSAISVPLSVLAPSFMLSEIQRAFEVGFIISLPFLIIDLVVSAILMSMGMMMVPPSAVALPFKLAFFVAIDGWAILAGSLIGSYQ